MQTFRITVEHDDGEVASYNVKYVKLNTYGDALTLVVQADGLSISLPDEEG